MSESGPGYQRFFAELKRRKVFRVAAVYGAVGFLVLQALDLAVPALLLPSWTYRFVALFLIAVFPVALVLAWAFEVTPDGVRKMRSASPGELERIVAQPPSQRWPSGLAALAGVLALVVGAWWIGRRTAPGPEPGAVAGPEAASPPAAEIRLALADADARSRPSIAVLPFADMSPDGDQEYFSDGITEELLNTLARIRDLKVTARTSTFGFKGRNLDVRELGDSLDVEFLVEGSVRKAGDQLRITAQLIDVADGAHLWSDQYDRELDDVFAIQTEIAESIARKLQVPLGLGPGQHLVSPTEDVQAYDLYLAGRARMRERGESVLEAIELFEAALVRDSGWAPAWAGLAESWTLVPHYDSGAADSAGWANSLAAAERAALRALALDRKSASALVALGNVHRERWEWEDAEVAYARALTLDPENVEAHHQYADYLTYVGRLAEAYAAAHRALALDRSAIRLNMVGFIAGRNSRPEEAIRMLSEGIRLDPEGRIPHLRENLMRVYGIVGDWAGYRELLLRYLGQVDPGLVPRVRAAWPTEGPPTPAVAQLITDENSHPRGAQLWVSLGEPERALEALETYLRRPPFNTSGPMFEPEFDPLRDDPRFQAILAARGLEGRRPVRLDGS